MTTNEFEVSTVASTVEKLRLGVDGEIGSALAVVALSSERVDRECELRDDLIRVAHSAGASLRQISEVSGLGRKTVTAIVADS